MIAPAARTAATPALVGGGNVIAEDRAAMGGAQPLGVFQVLHAERQAVQRRQVVAARHRRIGGLGGSAGAVEVARHHGVHRVVHRFDAGDAACQQFGRGQLLLPDQPAGGNGGEVAGFGHGRWPNDMARRS